MSSAFVPGLILLPAPVSTRLLLPGNLPESSNNATPGDAGPSWSSGMGGGEGRRGERAGEWVAILGEWGGIGEGEVATASEWARGGAKRELAVVSG